MLRQRGAGCLWYRSVAAHPPGSDGCECQAGLPDQQPAGPAQSARVPVCPFVSGLAGTRARGPGCARRGASGRDGETSGAPGEGGTDDTRGRVTGERPALAGEPGGGEKVNSLFRGRTMETNVHTFRHSSGKLILLFFGVLLLGFFAFSFGQRDYFLYGITGFAFFIALFYATSSVKISSEEITTNRLLGSKSLRWSEIARVSVFGQAVKLHNYDEDLVLSIDSQLDGYADILDIIFSKRSDLLDKNEDTVLTSSWLGTSAALGFGVHHGASHLCLFRIQRVGCDYRFILSCSGTVCSGRLVFISQARCPGKQKLDRWILV